MSTANAPYNLAAFFTDLCDQLALSPTPWRLTFLTEWALWENTGAGYNPLATTMPGGEDALNPWWNTFGDANQYHVRNYASGAKGVFATAKTLRLGYYDTIREALENETISDRPGIAAALRTWGTIGFANEVANGWAPQDSTDPGPEPAPAPAPPSADVDLNTATLARFAALREAASVFADDLTEATVRFAAALDAAADPDRVPGTGQ